MNGLEKILTTETLNHGENLLVKLSVSVSHMSRCPFGSGKNSRQPTRLAVSLKLTQPNPKSCAMHLQMAGTTESRYRVQAARRGIRRTRMDVL